MEEVSSNNQEIQKIYYRVVSAMERGDFDLWPYTIQTTTRAGTVFESSEEVTHVELAILKKQEGNEDWETIKNTLAERFFFYNRDLPEDRENALYACLGKRLTDKFIQDWWATLDQDDRYELKHGIQSG